jgi:hypothetical protein
VLLSTASYFAARTVCIYRRGSYTWQGIDYGFELTLFSATGQVTWYWCMVQNRAPMGVKERIYAPIQGVLCLMQRHCIDCCLLFSAAWLDRGELCGAALPRRAASYPPSAKG